MITAFEQLDLTKKYTYADYLTWQFEEFVELIRGKVFKMSAPSMQHQSISMNFSVIIGGYLRNNPCKVFSAPFDVRLPLPPDKTTFDKIDTVVQPDICIVCNPEQLDQRGCYGAPDWIIEILSKSTAKKDLTEKFSLYEHAGVREYWVVHPTDGTVIPYVLNAAGSYELLRPIPFTSGEHLASHVFPDLLVDLTEVFE